MGRGTRDSKIKMSENQCAGNSNMREREIEREREREREIH